MVGLIVVLESLENRSNHLDEQCEAIVFVGQPAPVMNGYFLPILEQITDDEEACFYC